MNIFVARQPIFDSKKNIFAYELLFRNSLTNVYDHIDGNQATSSVLNNSFFSFGIQSLTRGNLAFVNFTEKLLLDDVVTIFPKDQVAVEVLETVEPTPEIIEKCQNLKKQGYLLILDDFVFDPKFTSLVKMADIIKIDFLKTNKQQRKELYQKFKSKTTEFLAEKVESKEDFEEAKEIGYRYFQGYFFCKPEIISGQEIPGYKVTFLQLLKELHQPNLNFNKIEDIMKQDVSISYKFLKFINSAYFGFSKKIKSIKQALVLLGAREVKKWVTVITLGGLAQDKPGELIVLSLLRAKLCESIAEAMSLPKQQTSELFLMGLFSLIDAIVDRPISEVLKEIPLAEAVKTALIGGENNYSKIFTLILSYEKGRWEDFAENIHHLRLEENQVPDLFIKSVAWTNQIFSKN